MPFSDHLYLGAAYYPEHWPEERWPEDIRLMREAGITVARLGEFAWSTLEPAPGVFDFDWLDRAISQLADAGILSILGTPTAAPPVWLVQQHPDMMRVDEDGRRVQFGNRAHYCVNSPEFHEAARRVADAMAAHFGPNPHVIGWQIDNEFHRVCYCDHCRSLFQSYLADKFGSLDALNRHWSTRYWSQTYSAWDQIPLPILPLQVRLSPSAVVHHNPGLMIEFKRFVTDSYRRFQRLQIDVLRPHLRPGVWITHNFVGWGDHCDHYEMARDLDLASWDWYVNSEHHGYLGSGLSHDLVRGFKRQNFWVMEMQPGVVYWRPVNNFLNMGEGWAMAWHAVAHGADGILYWQYRSAPNGQEQYHGALVDQSGQPRPYYEEARRIGRGFAAVASLFSGTSVISEVAVLNSYDSQWSIGWQPHHRDFDYVIHLFHYYRPLAERNISTDVISADVPLDGYRLVIAPALVILNEGRAARLRAFVERGGHLVLTVRCGMKDDCNALLPVRQPGPLRDLAGVEVEEYFALEKPVPVGGEWLEGTAHVWAERLRLLDREGVEVVARYGETGGGWLDGHPAVTVHPYGAGCVYFVGAYLDEESQRVLMDRIVASAGVQPVLETPAGVAAGRRVSADGREVFIIVNHTQDEQRVQLPWPARERLEGRPVEGELSLEPYGVAVLTPSG